MTARIILAFWLSSPCALAQVAEMARFEKEVKASDDLIVPISLLDNGLALVQSLNEYEKAKRKWEFTRLDTTLAKVNSEILALENQAQLVGHDYYRQQLSVLFRLGDNNLNDLILVRFNTLWQAETYKISLQLNFKPSHFITLANTAILGGYLGLDPVVVTYQFAERQASVLPGFLMKDTELLDLRANQNGTFNVLLFEHSRLAHRIAFKTFDDQGALLLEDIIPIKENDYVLSAVTSTLRNDQLMVVGTWGTNRGRLSKGIFATSVDPFTDQPVHYTSFAEIDHYLDYLPDRKAKAIVEKAKEARQRGREPDFGSYFSLYKFEEIANSFWVYGEVYQPSSGTTLPPPVYNPFYDPFYGGSFASPYGLNPWAGRPYSYNTPPGVPSGPTEHRIFESVGIRFSPEGKIIQSFSQPSGDFKTEFIEQVGDFGVWNITPMLALKHEKDILVSYVRPTYDNIQRDTLTLAGRSPGEVIRNESKVNTGVRHWFANYFFGWGEHTVRAKQGEAPEAENRHVFYVSKIRF
ncbi:MAG: hypothetical protein JNL17_12265 [Cyclobacteriaceae bacterium]|nr:hypothetical protein [Cyclobacteriaceae bacterium]